MIGPKMHRLLLLLNERDGIKFEDQKDIYSSRFYYNYMVMRLQKAKLVTNHNFTVRLTFIGKQFIARLMMIDD